MFNKNSYNKLSANQKKVIDDHCTARMVGAIHAAPGTSRKAKAARRSPRSRATSVYPVSEKFRAEMLAAAAPAKKEWADAVRKAGYDPDQVWNSLVDAMKKHKAN